MFSGAVKVSDLNDYISPSQSCVVALNGNKLEVQQSSEVQLQPRATALTLPQGPGTVHLPPPKPGDAVKVTLHDCLACSGCITSAETVLLQYQSGTEFLAKLQEARDAAAAGPSSSGTGVAAVVVSVAPQSRAALAAYFGLPPATAWSHLVGWLRSLGVAAVFDLGTARDIALLETATEFVARFRAQQQRTGPTGSTGASEMDVDMEASVASTSGRGTSSSSSSVPGPLPMLASACPGWVCYAEKTHGDLVLPYISSTKSPQAVMGTIVKRLVAARLGLSDPGRVYHCSIMPCYDKKLEASRDELAVPGTQVPEVDSCLTTGEVLELITTHSQLPHLSAAPTAMPDSLSALATGQTGVEGDGGALYGLPGGSGGYMDFVFRAAAGELFGRTVPPGPLPLRTLRNADFQEVVLEGEGGAVLLRAAIANGFRNIQTLMRKIKLGTCEYHYVEVMACPSGCLNGGGQIKPHAGQTPQQLIEQLELTYHHADIHPRHPTQNPAVQALYCGWVGGPPGSDQAHMLLHTTYRKRENKVAAVTVSDW